MKEANEEKLKVLGWKLIYYVDWCYS